MGYTHYWYLNFEADPEVLKSKYKELLPIAKLITEQAGVPLKGDLTSSLIHLNGVGDDGHEDFVWFAGQRTKFNMIMSLDEDEEDGTVHKFTKGNFSFCKTAQKDYDVVVVAILCAVQRIYGDELVNVSSDGCMDGPDWEEGRALFERVFADLNP